MILMRTNPLLGPLEGVSPKSQDFFGPEMATSEASIILAQKRSRFSGPNPSNGPSNGFAME
jgi:hypothetical protein